MKQNNRTSEDEVTLQNFFCVITVTVIIIYEPFNAKHKTNN